ncbi:hypothetical protein DBV05_g8003 [Lasiodiplodia theobromae]|uniref:F-box domain-containing protein n=1 Tax=Lasiodiplodia theobromae TaxID=45133 RepID=A0A5N5D7K5_9PEZI|nr:hypothetical protein DBV05_g8003 [Lasiodiplodia theobromae]
MLPQSHYAAAAATTSEGMSAASGPLDDHPNLDAAPAEENSVEKTNTAASARLDKLPSELTTLITDHLDTKSLKQLRLCCKKLAMASSYTFRDRVPTLLPFFFMQSSMERLALLTENDRWNKHFEALEILSSSPDSMRISEHGTPCWTIHSHRHRRSRDLHGTSTHSDPAALAAPPRFGGGGTMPNVHTLTLCLNCDSYNKGMAKGNLPHKKRGKKQSADNTPPFLHTQQTDATQHEHLPALYAALPNLTTLHLTHAKTCPEHPLARTAFPGHPLAFYTPPPGASRLRRLCIKHSNIKSDELLVVMQAHTDTLETVEIGHSTIWSLMELKHFVAGRKVPRQLREVLPEKVDYIPLTSVDYWRWDKGGGVVSPGEERREVMQMLLDRMQAGTFDIRDLGLLHRR